MENPTKVCTFAFYKLVFHKKFVYYNVWFRKRDLKTCCFLI